MDNKQRLRTVDFYNKNGFKFAETIYDLTGKAIMKKYFDRSGKEIIYEKLCDWGLCIKLKNETHFFKSHESFIIYYLKQLNVDLSVVIFNSLAMLLSRYIEWIQLEKEFSFGKKTAMVTYLEI
ncbi:hypothetical protein [Staphylococcus epidermidis]|uniref:hypothetical protein n=1 Tax=Staphylococcus epidermidis TaxID=1282 RepID=UPI0037178339